LFTPLTNKRFTDRILAQLKDYILSHRIQRGERLPSEGDLAEMFEVSRGTIREALHILEHDGIVQIKKGPGGGIFLSDGNLLQLIDSIYFTLRWEQVSFPTLMEARKSLEDRIARLAALRAEKEDLEEIENILGKMESTGPDEGLFVQYDTDFHVALAKAAKNKILLMFMVALKELHNRVVDYSNLHESLFPVAISYHREILGAVKEGDPEKAAVIMAEHLEYFEKHFARHLGKESPLWKT
jgi:GntR family transcriptional regulator, transcriptional repressor for pyruvate dehydrogenase complex